MTVPPGATCVLLIRHAETAWNRERRWQGHADVPLTPEGHRQAGELAARIRRARLGIAALVSSDLRRATETASAIGDAVGLPVRLERDWREMDVGNWSGLGRDEIRERFPDEWRRILGGEDVPRGGGETFGAFTARVAGALDELACAHPGEAVAVVTHGGVIRALRLYVRGLPYDRLRDVGPVENTSLAELWLHAGRWSEAGPSALAAGLR